MIASGYNPSRCFGDHLCNPWIGIIPQPFWWVHWLHLFWLFGPWIIKSRRICPCRELCGADLTTHISYLKIPSSWERERNPICGSIAKKIMMLPFTSTFLVLITFVIQQYQNYMFCAFVSLGIWMFLFKVERMPLYFYLKRGNFCNKFEEK